MSTQSAISSQIKLLRQEADQEYAAYEIELSIAVRHLRTAKEKQELAERLEADMNKEAA